MPDLTAIFAAQGLLARHVPGFAPRAAQHEMAEAIAETLDGYGVLITEAGTGTGKTFAYLVPALLSGKKVIISTGTKNLQDQLFHRDLPTVQQALGVPARTALLKGRANYLCLHRLKLYEQRIRTPEQAALLARLNGWADRSETGDTTEMRDIPEGAPVWSLVTSSADTCLGQDCPSLSDCFVLRARRQAQECDILVVNHYLLCADMALRGDGLGELLPGANAVVVDEAHQLPEIATRFFGVSLSSGQLMELSRDTVAEHAREAGDMPDLVKTALRLEQAVESLHLAFGEPQRAAWEDIVEQPAVRTAVEALKDRLHQLRQQLEPAAVRGKGLENCWRRSQEIGARLALILNVEEQAQDYEDVPDAAGRIRWVEVRTRSFTVHVTPLDVSVPLHVYIYERKCAWVFTSATLAVGDSFDHFTMRLGLNDPVTRRWESPFDFPRQALLYIPQGMPDPNAQEYPEALVRTALPVLQASDGRAFLLFTSHRALLDCARRLEGQLDYPLLVQGSAPRNALLERFRQLGNAVLLGTSSFWEGVDVRGEALSLVIIDRLPFAAPSDPVLRAHIDMLRYQGADPFAVYQLPNAVITLKQGAGRLIRDHRDRGVLMLCDPRLVSRIYGRIFLNSLPAMRLTRELVDVERFFSETDPADSQTF
jgi:ATP-dependent DNA helicase DinG